MITEEKRKGLVTNRELLFLFRDIFSNQTLGITTCLEFNRSKTSNIMKVKIFSTSSVERKKCQNIDTNIL